MTHYMKRLTFILAILGGMLLTGCKSDAPAVQAADVPAAPYAVFEEGLIADIEPQGWLLEMLERQRDGLTGHPEAMAYPYDSPLWAGELKRDSENRGADWWRYEQTAYYLDGLARLGYILDDENLLAVWNENINYVLDHPLPAKKGVEKAPWKDTLIVTIGTMAILIGVFAIWLQVRFPAGFIGDMLF